MLENITLPSIVHADMLDREALIRNAERYVIKNLPSTSAQADMRDTLLRDAYNNLTHLTKVKSVFFWL